MWPLAVLTGDRINGFFFCIRKCMAVLPGRKKLVVITRVRRGSTEFLACPGFEPA